MKVCRRYRTRKFGTTDRSLDSSSRTHSSRREMRSLVTVLYAKEDPVASMEAAMEKAFKPEPVDGEKATMTFLAEGVSSIDEAMKGSPVVPWTSPTRSRLFITTRWSRMRRSPRGTATG